MRLQHITIVSLLPKMLFWTIAFFTAFKVSDSLFKSFGGTANWVEWPQFCDDFRPPLGPPIPLALSCCVVTSKWLGLLYEGLCHCVIVHNVQPGRKQNFDQHIYMRYGDCKYPIGGSRRRGRGSQISKYWEWPGEPTSSSQQARERVPLRIFPLMRFPDTHESYSLNGSSPFNSLYFQEIGCNVNGIQIKQRSWC